MAQTLTKAFSALGSSASVGIKKGDTLTYALTSSSFVGTAVFQFSSNGGQTQETIASFTDDGGSGTYVATKDGQLRFQCTAYTSGSLSCVLTTVSDIIQEFQASDGTKVLTIKEDGITTPKATITSLTASGGSLTGLTTFALSGDIYLATGAGAPVDYTDGDPAATGEAVMAKGSLYIDTTNGKAYINGGTKAEPVWKLITSAE